ncbi:MAG: hypothetical protein ACYTGX_08760 [Planctomycetota bacterium]|jgi:hypothetical protein
MESELASDGGAFGGSQRDSAFGPGTDPPEKAAGISTIGTLNLLFGFVCGCGGIGMAVLLVVLPGLFAGWQSAMQAAMQQQQSVLEQKIATAKADLADAQASGTPQDVDDAQTEKVRLEKALKQLNDVNPTKIFDSMSKLFTAPGMVAYQFLNVGVMLLGNLLWIISGFGILRRRSWGRTLAIGNAGFKIGAEVILAIIAVAVMPAIMQEYFQSMKEMMESLPQGAQQGAPFQQFENMGAQMTVQTIIGALMFMVYPAIVMVVMLQAKTKQEFADWAAWRA